MNSLYSRRASEITERIRAASGSRPILFALIGLHIVICCVSLVWVADYQWNVLFDAGRLPYALAAVIAFSVVALLFILARFSFGYFIGFNLFTMLLGFIWLNCFSKFNYDHTLAGLSAAASAVLFLLPALLITAPVKQIFALSPRAFEYLLKFILVLALGTVIVASFYNFRMISIGKFHGTITPTTPSGSRKVRSTPPGTGICRPNSRSGAAE